jgi:hypothetical protein
LGSFGFQSGGSGQGSDGVGSFGGEAIRVWSNFDQLGFDPIPAVFIEAVTGVKGALTIRG